MGWSAEAKFEAQEDTRYKWSGRSAGMVLGLVSVGIQYRSVTDRQTDSVNSHYTN